MVVAVSGTHDAKKKKKTSADRLVGIMGFTLKERGISDAYEGGFYDVATVSKSTLLSWQNPTYLKRNL